MLFVTHSDPSPTDYMKVLLTKTISIVSNMKALLTTDYQSTVKSVLHAHSTFMIHISES